MSRLGRIAEWLGWHKPGYRRANFASFNGQEAFCLRCGARLLMDSQGNWFAVGVISPRDGTPPMLDK